MSVAQLKEELYKAIEASDDPKFLSALLAAFSTGSVGAEDGLTDKQYAILKEREALYLKGELPTISLADWKAKMNARYGI